MSWRDLENETIEEVLPVDQAEVVLKLESGKLARIRAQAPPSTQEVEAELVLDIQKARR
jgi:hypothetical protein